MFNFRMRNQNFKMSNKNAVRIIFGLQEIPFLEFCIEIIWDFDYHTEYVYFNFCLLLYFKPGFNNDKAYVKPLSFATDLGAAIALVFAADLGVTSLTANWLRNKNCFGN